MKVYLTFLGLLPAVGCLCPVFGAMVVLPNGRAIFFVIRGLMP